MDDTTSIPQQERVMVTHHVKDFDAWKKAYDADSSRRTGAGLIQRGMTRGIDDPNMVGLLFAVTDLAKAKAAMTSPDMKKVMEAAGVDGPPTITWFKWVKIKSEYLRIKMALSFIASAIFILRISDSQYVPMVVFLTP
jgi:hypothetical protein